MPRASVVYWYDEESLRRDGGGLRALAWKSALESLGYDVVIHGLWTIGGGVARGSTLSAVKRALIPMPLERRLPDEAASSDLVVATVPAVFRDALRRVSPDRLVLDWMDLWSINARNVGDAKWTSLPGGRLQSRLWRRREIGWSQRCAANVCAGYGDVQSMRAVGGQADWIPTPVPYRGRTVPIKGISRLGFIGNLDYPPNQLSLRAYLDANMDMLADAGIGVVVAGFGSEVVAEWPYSVEILGEVDSVDEFYSHIDAAIVPIDHGGGIKVKAVEALAFGLPVFTTEHVRSGFGPQFEPYLLDISALKSPQTVSTIDRHTFESRFSQAAFSKSVRVSIDALRQ